MTKGCLPPDAAIGESILRLAAARGPSKTICPSEVARDLAGSDTDHWRGLMPSVREAAVRLARAGRVDIRQSGLTADPDDFSGIFRIAIRKDAPPS